MNGAVWVGDSCIRDDMICLFHDQNWCRPKGHSLLQHQRPGIDFRWILDSLRTPDCLKKTVEDLFIQFGLSCLSIANWTRFYRFLSLAMLLCV